MEKFDVYYYTGEAMKNKRLYPRVDADLQVELAVVPWDESVMEPPKKPFVTRTNNISIKGMNIKSLPKMSQRDIKRLQQGTRKLCIAIYFSDTALPITCFARLVWSSFDKKPHDLEGHSMGIQFLAFDNQFLEVVREYVDRHCVQS